MHSPSSAANLAADCQVSTLLNRSLRVSRTIKVA